MVSGVAFVDTTSCLSFLSESMCSWQVVCESVARVKRDEAGAASKENGRCGGAKESSLLGKTKTTMIIKQKQKFFTREFFPAGGGASERECRSMAVLQHAGQHLHAR